MGATSGKLENCTITITHKIHFTNNGFSNADFNDWVDKIKKQLKEVWEDPEFKYKCCKVKIKFEYSNTSGAGIDEKKLDPADKTDSTSSNGDHSDIYPKGHNHSERTPAHEIGHEMGMTDKYECRDKDDNTVPCYNTGPNGSIIDNPDRRRVVPKGNYPEDGLAFNAKDGTPKQDDIDEIVKKLGIDCPDSCCEEKTKSKEGH